MEEPGRLRTDRPRSMLAAIPDPDTAEDLVPIGEREFGDLRLGVVRVFGDWEGCTALALLGDEAIAKDFGTLFDLLPPEVVAV